MNDTTQNDTHYTRSGSSPPDFLSPQQVSDMTGIGLGMLNRWFKLTKEQGRTVGIPCIARKVPGDGLTIRLYKREDVETFMTDLMEATQ